MFSKIFPKIHTEGYKFIVIASFITIVLLIINNFLGLIGLLITIYAGHADHTDTESLIAIVPYGKRSSAAGAFEANGSKVRVV